MLLQGVALLAGASLAAASACKPKPPTTTTSASSSIEWETHYTATAASDVAAAAATALTNSPTSNVKGKAFDRIAIIWFENENYDKASGDPNFADFAKKGIKLTNYFGVTHPSEPNYMASIAGDYFGMENDDFNRAARNISTVIDLLEDAGISWGHYQEDMPYSGFEGVEWKNQKNGAHDYVRKHNPAVLHDSVASSERRLSYIKNLSMIDEGKSQFHTDLKNDALPQWMFITPNMTSDGHDTDVTTGGEWVKAFLGPLLDDPKFIKNTLVLITWDENETYAQRNHILGILLGDAVPQELVGTEDNTFYNHYSEIASVEANWDLPTLGRWDVGANVWEVVAKKTGDKSRQWSGSIPAEDYYYNLSYAGFFNDEGGNHRWPSPNLELDGSYSGRAIFQGVKDTWKGSSAPSYYKDIIEVNDGLHPPTGYETPQ